MKNVYLLGCIVIVSLPMTGMGATGDASGKKAPRNELGYEYDIVKTGGKDLVITAIGHGTLMFTCDGKVIHVDPVSAEGDYGKLPKADLILVTHTHGDHLDAAAIAKTKKDSTVIVGNPDAAAKVKGAIAMKNGDRKTVAGFAIEAVAAYNTTSGRTNFHPKGRDNGYVIDFGGLLVYVAGDTEPTPEMKALKNIAIAFLPMNQPYTMTPVQVADAARAFKPGILYPYHYGDTNPATLVKLLVSEKDIEVRVRDLQ
jgi:L-ascorbate metabolism protein UlaG (beta-lactamase superfamily)